MNIAFVGTSTPVANASQVRLYHLARAMADGGHRVTLVVPDDPVNREFPVTRGSLVAFSAFAARGAIREVASKLGRIARGNFDVVHVVGIGLRSFQLAGRPFKRPFYIQDYDEWMASHSSNSLARKAYYWMFEGATRARAHAVVVASRWLERLVRDRCPNLKQLLYLPIGYDSSLEGASPHLDARLRAEIGSRAALLWAGGFWPAYGIDEMVELAAALRARSRNFLLILAGDGPSLPAAAECIRERKLTNVVLPGRVSPADLQAYLRVANAFILPFPGTAQNLYRCPTKLFQYIAYNRPIVTNRTGEVAEALGNAGFYYLPGNLESMADACERAIAAAPAYDRSDLIPPIHWSQRALQYRNWIEGLTLGG